jgi:prophage maintenance system killer protein
MTIIRLTNKQIKDIHTDFIIKFNKDIGIKDSKFEIRNKDSLIYLDDTVYSKSNDNITDAFPTIINKAAYYATYLSKEKPFNSNNISTGILVMLLFLRLNKVNIYFNDRELIRIGKGLYDNSIDYGKLVLILSKKLNTKCFGGAESS